MKTQEKALWVGWLLFTLGASALAMAWRSVAVQGFLFGVQ